jgi:D-alanyl-D-alanine carboxypeptidase
MCSKSKMILSVLFVLFAMGTVSLASDSVEASVNSFLKLHKVPGAAVALIRDGKVLDEVVFGSANLQLAIPVQRHTVFQLASVTKSFAAITLLQLEQSGRLTLDDPLSKS